MLSIIARKKKLFVVDIGIGILKHDLLVCFTKIKSGRPQITYSRGIDYDPNFSNILNSKAMHAS